MQELALSYRERLAVAWVFWWRVSIIGAGVYFLAQNIVRILDLTNPTVVSLIFAVTLLVGLLALLPHVVGEMITKQYDGFKLRIIGTTKEHRRRLSYMEKLTVQGLLFWRGFLNGLVTLTPILLFWVFVAFGFGYSLTTIRIAAAIFVYAAAIVLVQPLVVKEIIRVTYRGFRLAVERGPVKEPATETEPILLEQPRPKRVREVPKESQAELI